MKDLNSPVIAIEAITLNQTELVNQATNIHFMILFVSMASLTIDTKDPCTKIHLVKNSPKLFSITPIPSIHLCILNILAVPATSCEWS